MFYAHLQCVYANVASLKQGNVVLSGTAIHSAFKCTVHAGCLDLFRRCCCLIPLGHSFTII